jgi:hypothetical protein
LLIIWRRCINCCTYFILFIPCTVAIRNTEHSNQQNALLLCLDILYYGVCRLIQHVSIPPGIIIGHSCKSSDRRCHPLCGTENCLYDWHTQSHPSPLMSSACRVSQTGLRLMGLNVLNGFFSWQAWNTARNKTGQFCRKQNLHQQRLLYVPTARFNIQQFYILPTQCVYVVCVDLRTNSDYFPIQY